jgi:2-amino-4-hydroxy-6-hydroxymethyldihydropteridine diphosphokinase
MRAFVLKPLADVAPDWVDPVSGKSVAALLAALPEADVAAVVATTT